MKERITGSLLEPCGDPGEEKPGGASRRADFGGKEKKYQRYHSLDISN
jgi:hypothetical protein